MPSFSIRLRRDDEAILHRIDKTFALGGRFRYYERGTYRGITSQPQVQFDVRGWRSCLRVVAVFDRYPLRAKKARDYATWRRLVVALSRRERGNRWHPFDYTPILAIAAELRDGRRYADG